MKIEIYQLSDLPGVAQQLLAYAGDEKIYLFDGEMGAGKTTFIKAFCKVLGVDDVVSSPTYSIVNEYRGNAGPVYHFDFYRIKDISEAYDLGYEEYFYGGGICLIEWPERIADLLPEQYVRIEIKNLSGTERQFHFHKSQQDRY